MISMLKLKRQKSKKENCELLLNRRRKMMPKMACDYHVLDLIGEGSFGKVYKGRKKHTGQVTILNLLIFLSSILVGP